MTNDLRQTWIDAKNAESEAWRQFMDANKDAPMRAQLDIAIAAEKAAWQALVAHSRKTNGSIE